MKSMSCAAGLIAVLFFSWGAQAQDHYAEPPPARVNPDIGAARERQLSRVPDRIRVSQNQTQQYRNYQQARGQTGRRPVDREHLAVRRQDVPPRARQGVQTAAAAVRPSDRSWHRSDPKWLPQVVHYNGKYAPGTIVIDTSQRFLFLVLKDGKARRYGVGVGKEGFNWSGTQRISQKREWPDWRPPAEMIQREKAKGRVLPVQMKGGPKNPLGARALYLGSTLYRIHGTNAPWTIGRAVSSGCIRMRNEDVIDLYNRVPVGTKVVVM